MTHGPMVSVASAPNEIQANIIGARLGAEGIVWELRPTVGAPYAVGAVEVLVEANRAAEARELLLVDEVETVFESDTAASDGVRGVGLVLLGAVVLVVFLVLRVMSLS